VRIGILQASSQREKNSVLETCVKEVVPAGWEVVNFGVYPDSPVVLSYVQAALCISMLLESKAVDFVITGCSSGQGMMLACNSLPGVLCGYVEHPTDAYLFGRINNGNAASYPLGMGWGWAGELNFKETVRALFQEPLGKGYPARDAERKLRDTRLLHQTNALCKRSLAEVLEDLPQDLVIPALAYDPVFEYVQLHGTDEGVVSLLEKRR
jgi:ribose 5-phosphate isomerase RpiB